MKIRSNPHLDFIKTLACVKCNTPPPSDPAHIRMGTGGGMGLKPHNKFTVPLCRTCHNEEENKGRATFWGSKKGEPLENLMNVLWLKSGDVTAANRAIIQFQKGEW